MNTEPASQEGAIVPRVQLNPTVTPEEARPIPSIAPQSAPAELGEAPSQAEPEPPFSEERPTAAVPVEIPSASGALDAALEAEINAALEGVGSLALGESASAIESEIGPAPDAELAQGAKVAARVLSQHGDVMILDLGTRANGVLSARSFPEGSVPAIGATVDVIVDEYDTAEGLYKVQPLRATVARPAGDWNSIAVDQIVNCQVVKTNKGGLEVTVSNLRGFLPAGQVDLAYCSNLEQFVGQTFPVKVLEVNAQKKNLIVSRRAYLEILAEDLREEAWKQLAVGQKLTGRVKTLKDYGAFVDIGGVDGLLHVSEISWGRIAHPQDVLTEGQQVEVQILKIDREKTKISLGMKQLAASPWHGIIDRYPPQSDVTGRVTRLTEFGAFVELEPGVEGLIHISELDHKRVHRVADVLKVGDEVSVKVLSVDPDKKRISLSRKASIERPESAAPKKSDEDLAPGGGAPYERKRKEPLKGGGTASGGLLFGSPGSG